MTEYRCANFPPFSSLFAVFAPLYNLFYVVRAAFFAACTGFKSKLLVHPFSRIGYYFTSYNKRLLCKFSVVCITFIPAKN